MKGRNNKMKKSHLLILAGVLVLLVTMCIGISAEDTAGDTTVAKIGTTGYTSLAQAINAAKDGETIIVTADTTTGGTTIQDKRITITSDDPENPKTVTVDSSEYNRFNIGGTNETRLTLTNIIFTRNNIDNFTYTALKVNWEAILHPIANGTAVLGKGATIKNSKACHGGAAFVEGGTFILDGGTIDNCADSWRTGAVAVDRGTFIMNSGNITNCKGAVRVGNGSAAVAELNGGTISGTTEKNVILVDASATCTISDSLVLTDNTTSDSFNADATVSVRVDSGDLRTALKLVSASNLTVILNKATVANRTANDDNYFNNRVFTVEGNGNTLSIEKSFPMWGDKGHITFKNVTVEMDNFCLGNSSKMTFDKGSVLTTPAAGVTGKVISVQGGGSFTPTITMKNGSAIKNAKSTVGVISLDVGVATLNMEDGVTVTGVEAQRLVDCYQQSILNIAGATIKDNTLKDGVVYAVAKTINVTNPSALTVENNGTNRIIAAATTNTLTVNVTGDWDSALTIDNKNYYVKSSIVAKTDAGLYESLNDAITATNNKDTVIYLLKDCDLNKLGIERSYILDGQGYTVNLKDTYTIVGKSNITLRNVIFDMKDYVASNNSMFVFWNGITFTLDNGAVIRNYTATGDTVFGSGCVFMLNGGSEDSHPTVIMKSGSLIEGIDCTNKDGNNGIVAYVGKCAVFEMQGGTIQDIKMGTDKSTTASNGAIFVANGGIFNMTGGTIQNVKTPSKENKFGGGVFVANGGTMNMSGGLMTNNFALEGGAVYLNGTMNMTGGEITGNYSWSGSGIRLSSSGKLNISGKAKVINNVRGMSGTGNDDNAMGSKAGIFIADNFEGQLGLKSFGTTLGAECGTVTAGTLKNIDCVVNDDATGVFACISGGKLIWTTKADLAIETDAGKYTKTDDETVYGVIRILTKSNSDAAVPVESFGTAYVKTGADETSINTNADYNFTKNETFENGKGHIVDVVDVNTGATYTYIPVSYYKIAGIDEMVYVTGTAFTFDVNAETVKELGKDPADLNY